MISALRPRTAAEDEDEDNAGPVVIGRKEAVRRAEAYDSDDSIDLNEEDEFDPEVVAALDREAAEPARERDAVARPEGELRWHIPRHCRSS